RRAHAAISCVDLSGRRALPVAARLETPRRARRAAQRPVSRGHAVSAGGVARFPLLALDDRVHLDRRRRADRAPHEAAARMTCTACGRSTARPLYAVAGFTIARCECGLARTEL